MTQRVIGKYNKIQFDVFVYFLSVKAQTNETTLSVHDYELLTKDKDMLSEIPHNF